MGKQITEYGLRMVHENRLIEREIDELIGLCKGAILDGSINQSEAEGIMGWLEAHGHCLDTWPASVLYDRLRDMLSDGLLDPDEEGQLLEILLRMAAPPNQDGKTPSALPIDEPPPPITIENHSFCFSGVFDYGSRTQCHDAVHQRGGVAVESITKKLHYLVIGNIGSEFWKHSNFGTKIAKAVGYREQGSPLIIVSEQHWVRHLK
jgi:NAD-dependent DNA ligase